MKCVNYVKYVKCVNRIYAMERRARPRRQSSDASRGGKHMTRTEAECG